MRCPSIISISSIISIPSSFSWSPHFLPMFMPFFLFFCLSVSVLIPEIGKCCPYTPSCGVIRQSIANLPGTFPLGKVDSHFL